MIFLCWYLNIYLLILGNFGTNALDVPEAQHAGSYMNVLPGLKETPEITVQDSPTISPSLPTASLTSSRSGSDHVSDTHLSTESELVKSTWCVDKVSEFNSLTPNFQSFEEWKKQKLNKCDDNKNCDNSTHSGNDEIAISTVKNSNGKNGRQTNNDSHSTPDINNDNELTRQVDKENIHHRIKMRDEADSKVRNGNSHDSQLGEEMMIEISMFAGNSDEEQGKLYKDRFNFASFDCAATIVKTNKEAKGANSILLENKDSYLLNECNAQNKFIIIELCEDILVDEVLIGNYEFYSSMFKNIKISVSDRFPATQWMVLGEFQAENVRQLQLFKIPNPLIWAKFLKIEFLTHYGDEFYCPISSVQVHGKTMIEQLKEENPDPDDIVEHDETIVTSSAEKLQVGETNDHHINDSASVEIIPEFFEFVPSETLSSSSLDLNASFFETGCLPKYLKLEQFLIEYEKKHNEDQCLVGAEHQIYNVNTVSIEENTLTSEIQIPIQSKIQPQDSIYKNIVKRLTLLESNTTLSLLYIEEQSRLLSDAFTNLESEQSIKFQNILLQLNSTIQTQMDIFQKLNTDVYTSFSRLFEYQQQSFDTRTSEISKQLSDISGCVSFYKNLTYFCILMIVLLFFYILLTKDLYIDTTYLSDSSFISKSPNFSPVDSPTMSPSNSIPDIRTHVRNFSDAPVVSDDEIENLASKETLQPISVVYRRRHPLLDSFSKWSRSSLTAPTSSGTQISFDKKRTKSYKNPSVCLNNAIQTPESSRASSPRKKSVNRRLSPDILNTTNDYENDDYEKGGNAPQLPNPDQSCDYEYVFEGDGETDDQTEQQQ